MKNDAPAADHAAAILNCAYMVRHYGRPGQDAARSRAMAAMARATLAALAAGGDAETVLYAVAIGLHDRGDKRFMR